MQEIRSRLTERGFSSDATSVMLNCGRPITQKVYNTYIQKREKYAWKTGICSSLLLVVQVCNFLAGWLVTGAKRLVSTEKKT